MGARMRSFVLSIILTVTIFAQAQAAQAAEEEETSAKEEAESKSEVSQILENMGYPELQVVPRASERLKLEAKAEGSSWFVTHWPLELSGLATLYTGISSKSLKRDTLTDQQSTNATTVATVATAVGAGWIIGALTLGAQRPYTSGYKSISKNTGKDDRSVLLRERLSEEALERPARTMRVLEVAAVVTNFSASALSTLYTNDQGKMIAGVSAIFAFLPLVFPDHNITVYDKHIEYKKKIYAPIKSSGFRYDPYSKSFFPVANLAWNF